MMASRPDKTSFAEDSARISRFHLSLTVDFISKRFVGFVEASVETSTEEGAEAIVLDTSNLDIQRIEFLPSDGSDKRELQWEFGEEHKVFGSALKISFPERLRTSQEIDNQPKIRIHYRTHPEASAVQWLEPEQTLGKQHPYVFTQCQAIHARSLFPCQDLPQNKCTYTAEITVPKPLVALMSAVRQGSKEDGEKATFFFEQPTPISSYLVGICCGNLVSRSIGPRSRVWSEPETIEAAEYEFGEVEKILVTAEDICGPYVWSDMYDVLVLPNSYPYGGMEHPCLTFVTPTLLAGDRSLVDVVAHEAAHSWSGNLFTARTWDDFFLNEGWTVWVERQIARKMRGEDMFQLLRFLGWSALTNSVRLFGENHEYTSLVLDLQDVDPDDAYSSVPYEKGFAFFDHLTDKVGGLQKMSEFFRALVAKFQYSALDSQTFREFFTVYFSDESNRVRDQEPKTDGKSDLDEILASDDFWNTWYHGRGLPPTPEFGRKLLDEALEFGDAVLRIAGKEELPDITSWPSQQVCVALEHLTNLAREVPGPSKTHFGKVLEQLDAEYGFAQSRNVEILFRFCILSIVVDYEAAFDKAFACAKMYGRMKFCRPLYRELFRNPLTRQRAVQTFIEHKDFYHFICRKMIARDLQLE